MATTGTTRRHSARPPAGDRATRRALDGGEANGRLTGTTAAVLLVLLAVEGVTILSVRSLLTAHVVIGMILVPPVFLKICSTGYRFFRYYTGAPAYRRKGPPAPMLRLLGPLVVVLTVAVLASGIGLLYSPAGIRSPLFRIHQASFVLWFAVLAIHVLGHLKDTAKLAPRDLYWRTRRQVTGASLRQWTVAASIGIGVLLASAVVSEVGVFLAR
jgi:hypothetical protein